MRCRADKFAGAVSGPELSPAPNPSAAQPLASVMLGAGGRTVFNDLMGRNLQKVYQEVLREPIPERFHRLLDWLDAGHRGP